jgi:tetratricopeptide (TPR) repeat protein
LTKRSLPSADDYLHRARILPQDDYDGKIVNLNEAIRLDCSPLAIAYNNRGVAYSGGKKDSAQAIADYDKAINLDPSNYVFYGNRGMEHEIKGNDFQALADYQKCLELAPEQSNAEYIRSKVAELGGMYDPNYDDDPPEESLDSVSDIPNSFEDNPPGDVPNFYDDDPPDNSGDPYNDPPEESLDVSDIPF